MLMNSFTRRDALRIAVTTAAGSLIPQQAFAQAAGADTSALLPGSDVCVLIPETTEGPYYFDPALVREDITEGRAGVPVALRLQVVDAGCKPMPGARVDVWHCDAAGLYSNYAGQGDDQSNPVSTKGETFLRGTQLADARGIVTFRTIYPGWYPGRTTHVHFKVFLDKATVLTGQIFFPDGLSEFIYKNVQPYSDRRAVRDTLNEADFIARMATRASFAHVKEDDDAYLVSLIVGVDPARSEDVR
jgi:protocatechuate 3,4-dioxygenase beta subunit